MSVFEEYTARQRRMWGSGDWPEFAATIQPVSDAVVELVGVEGGHRFLDVGTGSGNAAVAAAHRGATVTGLDLVASNVAAARERSAAEGVDAEWVEGDAEALPFADGSFDRVTSVFGCMFAPRHEQAADELARVAAPGAAIAVTAWTPKGLNGSMFGVMARHLPPPPEEIQPHVLWGVEEHVRGLLERPGVEVSCERRTTDVEAQSVEAWIDYCERLLSPVVMAKAALEPSGGWEAARADLAELYTRANQATDGSLRAPAEYLLTVARIAA